MGGSDIKKFLNDVFYKNILAMLVPYMVIRLCCTDKNGITYVLLLSWLIVACFFYIWKCFQQNNLDRKTNYVKWILFIREIVICFAFMVVWGGIAGRFSYSGVSKEDIDFHTNVFIVIIAYRFLVAVLAILLGVRISTMLLLLVGVMLAAMFVGTFDVRWWAAVTGLLALWNYLNSKDFLILLRKGKTIGAIPPKLEYLWQRNKILAHISTVIFYISLIISSFFEKEKKDILENLLKKEGAITFQLINVVLEIGIIRIHSFLFVFFILAIISMFCLLYSSALKKATLKDRLNLFEKCILKIGKKLWLDKLQELIDLYKISKLKK